MDLLVIQSLWLGNIQMVLVGTYSSTHICTKLLTVIFVPSPWVNNLMSFHSLSWQALSNSHCSICTFQLLTIHRKEQHCQVIWFSKGRTRDGAMGIFDSRVAMDQEYSILWCCRKHASSSWEALSSNYPWSPQLWWERHQNRLLGVCRPCPSTLAERLSWARCRLQSWWKQISSGDRRDSTSLLNVSGVGWGHYIGAP